MNLSAGGNLYLRSLTTLPEGVTLSAGGDLDLSGLTTLPEGVNLSAGGNLYLGGLKNRPEGIKKTFAVPFITKDGKTIIADRICQELVSKKGNIYKVRSYGQNKITYLVVARDKCAHGDTIKEARDSLVYKIGDRDTSKFKGMNKETVLKFADAIEAYRSITGACEAGTRGFIESLGKAKKAYTVGEIMNLTAGKFGNETFRGFFK